MSIARHIDESAPGDGLWWGWFTVGLVGAIDSVWAWHTGFDFHGFPQAILIVGTLVTIGLYYGYSGRNPRFRDLGHYLALWLVFPLALNIYSYLAATLHFPLCDAQLSALDESLGFHWLLWARPIYAHKVAKLALLLAYDSIFLQGFASVAFFALTGNTQRNRELLWIAMLAAIATVVISGFAPALGPMTAGHRPGVDEGIARAPRRLDDQHCVMEYGWNCRVPFFSYRPWRGLYLRPSAALLDLHTDRRAQ